MTLNDLDNRIEHILAMGSGDIAVLNEFPPERCLEFIGGFTRIGFDNRRGASIEHLKPFINLLVNDIVTVEEKNLNPNFGVQGKCNRLID